MASSGTIRRSGDTVGVGAHRGFGGDHADPAVPGRGRGAHGAGLDHAPDRQSARGRIEAVERQGGGGVAGDHDRLDAPALEELEIHLGVAAHGRRGLRAVGQPGGVAEIEQTLARQAALERRGDRQSPDARVEDADRPRVAHEASRSARNRSGCPVSTWPASEDRCTPFQSSTTRLASGTFRSTVWTTA